MGNAFNRNLRRFDRAFILKCVDVILPNLVAIENHVRKVGRQPGVGYEIKRAACDGPARTGFEPNMGSLPDDIAR